jgi:endo-1,4-beta-mannosidase
VISAQLLQIKEVSLALKGNEAIWAYDLGNEASNWVIPPQRSDAQLWLDKMTSQIKNYSGGKMVTLGMHAEDLEEDRRLWPQDAAQHCDFLCMHGYPFYLSWMDDPFDSELVPFLGIITTWLGQKPVLFQEFGVPTRPVLTPTGLEDSEKHIKCLLWSEDEGAIYYNKTLKRLLEERMMGGLAWCFADYSPLIWDKPPLDFNLHERYFGMFRYDGSAKPAVKAFHHYKDSFINTADPCLPNYPWLEKEDRDKFYQGANDLPRLYRKYKEWLKNKQ